MLRPFNPLDAGFNVAVQTIARRLFPTGYDVAEEAPATLEQLNAHIAATGRMLVWSGASERTIFDDAETNYAFRAWHDWCHWKGQLPFNEEGERAAYAMQLDHLRTVYGERPEWEAILHAEVVGQFDYAAEHGHFPEDQRAFVASYLQQARKGD